MKFKTLAIATALCAISAVQVEARTLYVDAKRPNNKGNGLTAKTAKKTIQAAINIAKKGDTIVVAPGSYAPIKTNNKKIKITALKGVSKTKIVKPAGKDKKVALAQLGKSYNVYIDTYFSKKVSSGIWTKGTSSTLEGFLLDGMNRSVGSGGELIGVSGGTVRSCRIQRLGKKYARVVGSFGSCDYASVAVNSSLIDCSILNNRCNLAPEEYMAAASGGKVKLATGSKFLRCVFGDNQGGGGIESGNLVNCLLYGTTTQYALFWSSTLLNCTVANNTVEGRWNDPSFSIDSKYYNCILWKNYVKPPKKQKKVYGYEYYDADGNWIGYRSSDATTFSIEYTDALGEWVSADGVTEKTLSRYCPGWTKTEESYTDYVPGTSKKLHNVDSGNTYKNTDKTNKNPKFAAASKNNYKLKKGSYAIDKGRLTASQKKTLGATDLAGGKRINGKYVDRGCYEY